jgi:hypothetical protein
MGWIRNWESTRVSINRALDSQITAREVASRGSTKPLALPMATTFFTQLRS